ncbi:MAG: hypothetical protein AB8B96_19385 [Lysobacterales bacterium]
MKRVTTVLISLLTFCSMAVAQTLPTYSASDDALLLEYDRYSLKIHRPDTTPLMRIYGSGRVQVYFSEFSPKAGLYETQLSADELDTLILQLSSNGLDQNASTMLAESTEEASINASQSGGALYYSSEATVSVLNMLWDSAGEDPLIVDNLQQSQQQFPTLTPIQDLAAIERQLLELANSDLGAPVANAKSLQPKAVP